MGLATGPIGWLILGVTLSLSGASLLAEGGSYFYNRSDTKQEKFILNCANELN
jgi:hypothetical protein